MNNYENKYRVSIKTIAITLVSLFFVNTISSADIETNTLSPKLFFSDARSNAEIQATTICKLIEKRAKKWKGKTIEQIYTDDMCIWAKSSEPLFDKFNPKLSINKSEIIIDIPQSNIRIRYYDSDQELNKTFPAHTDWIETRTEVIYGDINRQIIHISKTLPTKIPRLPALDVKLSDTSQPSIFNDDVVSEAWERENYMNVFSIREYLESENYFYSILSPEMKDNIVRRIEDLKKVEIEIEDGTKRTIPDFIKYVLSDYGYEDKIESIMVFGSYLFSGNPLDVDIKIGLKGNKQEDSGFISKIYNMNYSSKLTEKSYNIIFPENSESPVSKIHFIFDAEGFGSKNRQEYLSQLYLMSPVVIFGKRIYKDQIEKDVFAKQAINKVEDLLENFYKRKILSYLDSKKGIYRLLHITLILSRIEPDFFKKISPKKIYDCIEKYYTKKIDSHQKALLVLEDLKSYCTPEGVSSVYIPFLMSIMGTFIREYDREKQLEALNVLSYFAENGNFDIETLKIFSTFNNSENDQVKFKTQALIKKVAGNLKSEEIYSLELLEIKKFIEKKNTEQLMLDRLEHVTMLQELPLQLVFFDWDGTIADTTKVSVEGFLKTCENVFKTREEGVAYFKTIDGCTIAEQFKQVAKYAQENNRRLKHEDEWAFGATWIDNNKAIIAKMIKDGSYSLIDGAVHFLKYLHKEKIPIFITSGQTRNLIEMQVKMLGLSDIIADIHGSSIEREIKNETKAEFMKRTLKEKEISPKRGAMFGDTPNDMKSALDAGVIGIGIAKEMGRNTALYSAGASLVLPDYTENHSFVKQRIEQILITRDPVLKYQELLKKNIPLISTLLSKNKDDILLRVPLEGIEYMNQENVQNFFDAFQHQNSNGYIELFYASGAESVGEKMHKHYNLREKPSGFKPTKENTITLMPVFKGEISSDEKQARKDIEHMVVTRIGSLEHKQTQVVPIGYQNDSTGLIRGLVTGLVTICIAREKTKGEKENSELIKNQYVRSILDYYDPKELKRVDLTAQDIIDLATGDINKLAPILEKLINLLPVEPIDSSQIYQKTREVLIAA